MGLQSALDAKFASLADQFQVQLIMFKNCWARVSKSYVNPRWLRRKWLYWSASKGEEAPQDYVVKWQECKGEVFACCLCAFETVGRFSRVQGLGCPRSLSKACIFPEGVI
eukprot:389055-Pelagomonas_calceolata.AAC.1